MTDHFLSDPARAPRWAETFIDVPKVTCGLTDDASSVRNDVIRIRVAGEHPPLRDHVKAQQSARTGDREENDPRWSCRRRRHACALEA